MAEVRRQIKMGADWIKVHVSGLIPNHRQRGELCVWSREELEIVCQTSHDLGTPVMGHCRGSSSVFEAARAGFDLILHGTLMEADTLDMVIERKVPIAPTLTFQANLIDFGHQIGAAFPSSRIFSVGRSRTVPKRCARPMMQVYQFFAVPRVGSLLHPTGIGITGRWRC